MNDVIACALRRAYVFEVYFILFYFMVYVFVLGLSSCSRPHYAPARGLAIVASEKEKEKKIIGVTAVASDKCQGESTSALGSLCSLRT
jgi:hypothetical protein